MPTTRTITIYKYDELSESAKDTVRAKYIGIDLDMEHIIDDAKREGEKRGFDLDEVLWSGFNSQGDGASWTGQVKLQTFLEHHLKENDPNYAKYTTLLMLIDDGWVENLISISRKSFMYNHANTMRIDQEFMGYVNATEEAVIGKDGPLQGANVLQLYEGLNIHSLLDDLYEWVLKEAKDYANEIYERLESEYEDLMSDQHISLTADANGWEFDETGRLI